MAKKTDLDKGKTEEVVKKKLYVHNGHQSYLSPEERKKKAKTKPIYDIKKYIEEFGGKLDFYIKGMLVSNYKGLLKEDKEWEAIIKKETTKRIS